MFLKFLIKNTFFKRDKKNGFTLVETLVAIAIFALIIGVISQAFISLFRSHNYSYEQSQAVSEARKGVDTMVREIREAREGEDGSYPIEKAGDNEFIFYSDINGDGKTERVRYFLGSAQSGSQIKECVSFTKGGSCQVNFSDFLKGTLVSAKIEVSVEGDFGWSREYADIFADGVDLGNTCKTGCSDCAGQWQGTNTFDVTDLAKDGTINLEAKASNQVDPYCNWVDPHHSMKVKFKLTWEEKIPGEENKLEKGVIGPTSDPAIYPLSTEKISTISSYVRNTSPIFEYFDADGNKITDTPAKLSETKMMKVSLVINVDPNRAPDNFQLDSYIQLRNLKEKY